MNKNCSTNDCGNLPGKPQCESKVVNSTTLGECSNWCKEPYGTCGPIVAKVPVVLADCKIQIDVEACIHLDEPAFDIKTIDKKVCITQCHVVPYTNKLFLEGYVQKNIQYSTVECSNKTSISGSILHTTLNVPFKCVTAVCFDKWPILGKSFKSKSNVLDKSMLCTDDKEDSWTHFEKPFEPIFCELEWAKILETDIYDRKIKGGAEPFTKENLFQDFTEKMVVYVRIKVLQNRSVYIPEPACLDDIIKDMDKKDEKEYGIDSKNIEVGYVEGKGVIGRVMED
jgi:hypothetical protein